MRAKFSEAATKLLVKTKRSYESKARQEAADERRQRVLDAAMLLFSHEGIDRVTIDQIAKRSKVAASTVYALFQSKVGILRALMHRAVFNSAYEEKARSLQAASDPLARLRMTASVARSIYQGEAKELRLLRGVSAFSPELKEIELEFESRRYELQRDRVNDLQKNGLLRPGMSVRRARQVLWTLTGRELFCKLVVECGWPPAEYERWLAQTLVDALIRPTSDPRASN